jgi:hypothetical protein
MHVQSGVWVEKEVKSADEIHFNFKVQQNSIYSQIRSFQSYKPSRSRVRNFSFRNRVQSESSSKHTHTFRANPLLLTQQQQHTHKKIVINGLKINCNE